MNRTVKSVLLGLWALLFVLCGIDGVTQAQKAAFLSWPVAQVLGALYFLNLYGLCRFFSIPLSICRLFV